MDNLLNNIVCNNCSKKGHFFYQCKLPITSYGIVLFRYGVRGIEYLMICRKDTYGYIDFVRGKYSPYNIYQLQNIVNEMSIFEKQQIISKPFSTLWKNMWGNVDNSQYKNEETMSSNKYDLITKGILINNDIINLKDIVTKSNTSWVEQEWEFPKGRRNRNEKDICCALREFEEETGIPHKSINIIENVIPFEEMFIGTNYKSYKNIYFLAYIKKEEDLNNFQTTEVSKAEWKTIDECLEIIRPYNYEKKNLITNINKVLQEYIIL